KPFRVIYQQVLVLKSIFTEPNILRIISEPSKNTNEPCDFGESSYSLELTNVKEDEGRAYFIEVDVKIKLCDHGITVTVQQPCATEGHELPKDGAAAAAPDVLQYQRTPSGYHWNTSFRVHFLTPVTLRMILPSYYPSDGPPQFSLICQWMDSKQLALEIEDVINLGQSYTAEELNGSNVLEMHNIVEEVVHSLLIYNGDQDMEAFRQSWQTCGVCYEEMLGSKFFRLADCQHHFCIGCMSDYCQFHVQEGTVTQLMCPETGCKTVLPPSVLQSVLDNETLQRLDRLLFQNALDTMSDISWCPRCNNPVIKDREEHSMLAYCMTCFYSFCTKCMGPWHLSSDCPPDEEDGDLSPKKDKEDPEKLPKVKRARMLENVKSVAWIKAFSKPCPSCHSPIVKENGCNKVKCTRCYNSMCWQCGKQISGYEHFSNCNQWTQMTYIPHVIERPVPEGLLQLQRHQQNPRQNRASIKKCPKCKHDNLKQGRDNHIHCWFCQAHFCFLCLEVLHNPITSHYMKGRSCVQHSS
ncbi:hypothetical protein LSH36_591g01016, partial [Paralvinella palmiformis]